MKLPSAILPFTLVSCANIHLANAFTNHQISQPHHSFKRMFTTTQIHSDLLDHQQAVSPVFDEVCGTTGITLTRFMQNVERVNPELQELSQLFSGIQTSAKAISNLVKRSHLPNSGLLGLEGAVNVQGEDQKVSLIFCLVGCECQIMGGEHVVVERVYSVGGVLAHKY